MTAAALQAFRNKQCHSTARLIADGGGVIIEEPGIKGRAITDQR